MHFLGTLLLGMGRLIASETHKFLDHNKTCNRSCCETTRMQSIDTKATRPISRYYLYIYAYMHYLEVTTLTAYPCHRDTYLTALYNIR